jgi:hypothetical protein
MTINKLKFLKIFIASVFLFILAPKINRVLAQSLSGTTWNITVQSISPKPYNFIFSDSGNKGNVLKPNGKLADFTWVEDGKGNWSIQIMQMIDGVQKIENLYGKFSGNSGSGYYISFKDKSKMLPLTMTKK